MVVIYHQNNRITKIKTPNNESLRGENFKSIANGMLTVAQQFPKAKIVWCQEQLQDAINFEQIDTLFHHNKLMLSYSLNSNGYLGKNIGYVEESPFIKVNKKVCYPTWLMNSDIGVIHASVLNIMVGTIQADSDFDYFLNSVAKIGMILGLLCYSEPQLLLHNAEYFSSNQANSFTFFRFVKQHYKKRWQLLLFLNVLLFEKQFSLLPLLCALFYKSRKQSNLSLDSIIIQSSLNTLTQKTIDVIIPTIGRKSYLYDVLLDLEKQTLLPINVIIVEQNPISESSSELDYLTSRAWSFTIKHTFTHQAGACNARNLALSQVESEWVFLNDDDNRFSSNLIESMFAKVQQYGAEVITTAYLQENEKQKYIQVHQSGIFGSGNSFVKRTAIENLAFNMALEFGYGEDTDFGMQLRNHGADIIYLPELKITHLKAPMGGFRIKVKQAWENEKLQPKPSPTIMYVFLKHYTREQLLCYKLVSFIKLLKRESVSNYFLFFKNFNKKWNQSLYWANKL